MKSPEGIQKFIEYKQGVEKERPFLTGEQNLITIDGVDGVGKSSIARKFVEKLQERLGKDKAILVDITNLRGSPKQEKVLRIENEAEREKYLNTFVEKLTTNLHLPEKRNGDE